MVGGSTKGPRRQALKAHKILYTIPNLITAGSGRALFEIARRLDRERFEPTVCVGKAGGSLTTEMEEAGIEVIEAPFTVPAKPYFSLWSRARRIARDFPTFDLWHSFHYLDDYTEPLIARCSGARAWVYTKKNMSWNRRSWALRTRLASAVAAQNCDMMEGFFSRPKTFRRKTRFVPRGVDTDRFTPAEVDRRSRGGKLEVGCVAHLVRVKGHPTLVEALSGCSGYHLRLAGKPLDETYVAELREQIEGLGLRDRVEMVGGIGDVPSFLRELDVFVLPTWGRWRMEGCPVALLEAMASGLAVIATDIPGSRDLVRHGESGLLVPPEDPRALHSALLLLTDEAERRRLGENARRRMEEKYSIEREVADHQSIYASLLGK